MQTGSCGGRLDLELRPEFQVFGSAGRKIPAGNPVWRAACVALFKMVVVPDLSGEEAVAYNALVTRWKRKGYKTLATDLKKFVENHLEVHLQARLVQLSQRFSTPRGGGVRRKVGSSKRRLTGGLNPPNVLPIGIKPVECARGGECVPSLVEERWKCGCRGGARVGKSTKKQIGTETATTTSKRRR